jgi:hypothetical protein
VTERRVPEVWVDESARPSVAGIVYVVAGVRMISGTSDLRRLYELLLPGQRYLHWRDESKPRRREIVGVINEMRLDIYVAHAQGVALRGQEAARRACLGSVVREVAVDDRSVALVSIEGRGRALDLADRYTVRNECRDVLPGAPPEVAFVSKTASPLLWIADAVSSMASAHFAHSGGSDFWWRSMQPDRLTLRRVEP